MYKWGKKYHNILKARRDFLMLNEVSIIRTSVERSVYCKGARAWNSLQPTERNLPCLEAFKHHQKCNAKEITKIFLSLNYNSNPLKSA